MRALNAAEAVLRDATEPLTARQITDHALAAGLWTTKGRTPDQTMAAQLAVDIKRNHAASRFRRAGAGLFELNRGRGQEPSDNRPVSGVPAGARQAAPAADRLSFLDAAEQVLERRGDQTPRHYRELTQQAIDEGLITSAGQTPAATLRAQIGVENRRREARGERPRFTELGRGLIGLTAWQPEGILSEIERHNDERRRELLDWVKGMPARGFEQLVGELLSALGFEIVAITPFGGDGGIDVRAEVLAGGVLRIASQYRPSAGPTTCRPRRSGRCAAAWALTSGA